MLFSIGLYRYESLYDNDERNRETAIRNIMDLLNLCLHEAMRCIYAVHCLVQLVRMTHASLININTVILYISVHINV